MKRFSHLRSESYLRKRTIMREKIENQSEALEEYGILSNENNEEFIIKEFCI